MQIEKCFKIKETLQPFIFPREFSVGVLPCHGKNKSLLSSCRSLKWTGKTQIILVCICMYQVSYHLKYRAEQKWVLLEDSSFGSHVWWILKCKEIRFVYINHFVSIKICKNTPRNCTFETQKCNSTLWPSFSVFISGSIMHQAYHFA